MASLTDTAENLVGDWVTGIGTPTRPTTPLKLALLTAIGSDSAAGTEVVGGSYARQNITLSAFSAGATSNSAEIRFTSMPAATVVGYGVYDSFGTPVRLFHGAQTPNKTTNAGDDYVVPIGDLDLTFG